MNPGVDKPCRRLDRNWRIYNLTKTHLESSPNVFKHSPGPSFTIESVFFGLRILHYNYKTVLRWWMVMVMGVRILERLHHYIEIWSENYNWHCEHISYCLWDPNNIKSKFVFYICAYVLLFIFIFYIVLTIMLSWVRNYSSMIPIVSSRAPFTGLGHR